MSIKQKEKIQQLEKINKLLRYWILDMTTTAGSGHPTSSLSAVEIMSSLMFSGVFKFDIKNIRDENNDRLIFSKGHASPLFYSLWTAAGAVKPEELNTFRKFGSNLEGHPTMKFPFTEASTGSLGQGLSVGVGMALAQKKIDKSIAKTYVLLGDSEMAEGQVWEAMNLASYYELGNLIAVVDVNRLGQRGETMDGHDVDKYVARAKAFGWRSVVVDGHDVDEILRVYKDMIGEHKKPLMIIAKTYKGRGISFLEDKYSWHGKVLKEEEFIEAVNELGDIDFDVRGSIALPQPCQSRDGKYLSSDASIVLQKDSCLRRNDNSVGSEFNIDEKYATRDAYGDALVEMMSEDEKIIVLDAEVSNSTRSEKVKAYYPERFFEMFIAEQNMVSVAVGLSRMGYKPFCSTFAAFFTRAHDQIRMARLSESNITFVGSHAGVSIGADGSSQMGLSDIAMMRSIIDGKVLYPSDIISAKFLIKNCGEGINYIRTTREKTSVLYGKKDEFKIGDSKILKGSDEDIAVIIAAGITITEALKAYEILKVKNKSIRIIDLYCVKPINGKSLIKNIGDIKNIIVVEDGYSEGGMYEAVRSALDGFNGNISSLSVKRIPQSGTTEELLKYEEIDFNAIIKSIEENN
ncbi:MAG: transketolase [Candidatus Moraniibacteriota bacterium]|jgi:transketolase